MFTNRLIESRDAHVTARSCDARAHVICSLRHFTEGGTGHVDVDL